MDWLSKLKDLINIDLPLSQLKKLSIKLTKNLSHNKLFEYSDNSKSVTINIGRIDADTMPKLKELIGEFVHEENGLLIEEKSKETLEEFKHFEIENRTIDTIDILLPALPNDDIRILRAAKFIKYKHGRGESVSNLKKDVFERYGKRGANITNLYTAGYYESIILPIYQALAQESSEERLNKFRSTYETIVTQLPFALFIHRGMSNNEIKSSIEQKLQINERYGLAYLNIHGIGEDNVKKILEVVAEITPSLKTAPIINAEVGFITVRIKLNDPQLLEGQQ